MPVGSLGGSETSHDSEMSTYQPFHAEEEEEYSICLIQFFKKKTFFLLL